MRFIFSILVSLVILSSCSENAKPQEQQDSTSGKISDTTSAVTSDKKRTPEETVKYFLIWYNLNYKDISKIEMVNNNPPVDDTLLWYSVNFAGTEKWLDKFKKSGFVSDDFILYWRTYFKDCEKEFQKNHASDGPPEGFDADFIYESQEEFPSIPDIINAIAVKVNAGNGKTQVILTIPNYGVITKFLVQSPDGKWLLTE